MMFVNTLGALWKEDAVSPYFIMKNLEIQTDAHILKLLWNIQEEPWITDLFSDL